MSQLANGRMILAAKGANQRDFLQLSADLATSAHVRQNITGFRGLRTFANPIG